jgi:hypothetical protein
VVTNADGSLRTPITRCLAFLGRRRQRRAQHPAAGGARRGAAAPARDAR